MIVRPNKSVLVVKTLEIKQGCPTKEEAEQAGLELARKWVDKEG
jgi:hypothetical protein